MLRRCSVGIVLCIYWRTVMCALWSHGWIHPGVPRLLRVRVVRKTHKISTITTMAMIRSIELALFGLSIVAFLVIPIRFRITEKLQGERNTPAQHVNLKHDRPLPRLVSISRAVWYKIYHIRLVIIASSRLLFPSLSKRHRRRLLASVICARTWRGVENLLS